MIKRKKCFLISLIFLLGIAACRPAPFFPARNVVESNLPIQLQWQAQVDEQVDTQPVISKDMVVVATDRALYGFEKESGVRQWRYEFNGYQPSPVELDADDDIVVYGDKNGLITALQLSSGELLWKHHPCTGMGSSSSNSIIVADGVIYAAFQPTVVQAWESESGDRIWKQCNRDKEIPSRGARLFLEEEELYVMTYEVHVLNIENGEIERTSKVDFGKAYQLENGRFYGESWVRDAKTLRLINKLEASTNCKSFDAPYTFYQEQFFSVGYCGGLFSLDQETNNIQWSYKIDLEGTSPIAIYNDILYALFENGEIHAIKPSTGNSMGILKTDASVTNFADSSNGIVADEDILIVVFNDNNVWAFE